MKRLSLYSALVLFVGIISGCSEISNPTAPLAQDQAVTSLPLSSVTMLNLPQRASALSVEQIVSNSVLITADGGDVPLSSQYTAANGSTVTISMNLHFAPGTVKESTRISISLDTESLVADFSPSGTVFNTPAVLTANISGLDLRSLSPSTMVKLFYINQSFCQQMNGTVSVNPMAGTLVLSNGQIPHFSLYGFGFLK